MSPRVISLAGAHTAGTTPESLRQVAAWNSRAAEAATRSKPRDQQTADRCEAQAFALLGVADEVERLANRKSRRRATA